MFELRRSALCRPSHANRERAFECQEEGKNLDERTQARHRVGVSCCSCAKFVRVPTARVKGSLGSTAQLETRNRCRMLRCESCETCEAPSTVCTIAVAAHHDCIAVERIWHLHHASQRILLIYGLVRVDKLARIVKSSDNAAECEHSRVVAERHSADHPAERRR